MTILPSRLTPIAVTTADPTGIQLDEIFLRLPSGAIDVVWDGSDLASPYAVSSTRTEVSAGLEYAYSLRRAGGWPFAFELFVRVIDVDGNTAEDVYPFTCPAVAPPAAVETEGPRRVGSDLTDEDGTPTETIPDHAAQAKSNLIQFFQGKPRIDALLDSYAAQTQELETALWAMLTERGISSALGVQLDDLGDKVGELRQDREDEPYRAAIRVRVLVNRSQGKAEELITIAKRMTGLPVILTDHYPASMRVRLIGLGDASGGDVSRMLRQAKAGGVGLSVLAVIDPDRSFAPGNTPTDAGLAEGAAPTTGWGSTTTPSAGGLWASVL